MSQEELQKLYDQEGTVEAVAKILGKPRSTTVKFLKRRGVVLRKPGIHDSLTNLKVEFQSQYRINFKSRHFTLVDIFIAPNICVYADGDYWHGLPGNKRKDERITRQLSEMGFVVLRLKEKDIKNKLQSCLNDILALI